MLPLLDNRGRIVGNLVVLLRETFNFSDMANPIKYVVDQTKHIADSLDGAANVRAGPRILRVWTDDDAFNSSTFMRILRGG